MTDTRCARRTGVVLGVSTLALALVLGCWSSIAWASKPERLSDRAYARQVCTALADLQTRETTLATEHGALDASRPAAFQREAVALLEQYVTEIRSARSRVSAVAPVSSARPSRAFDQYFAAAIARLDRVARRLRDADPHAAVFQADVSTFEANLQFLADELPDPFARIHDQALLAALRDEPSCVAIVAIGQP